MLKTFLLVSAMMAPVFAAEKPDAMKVLSDELPNRAVIPESNLLSQAELDAELKSMESPQVAAKPVETETRSKEKMASVSGKTESEIPVFGKKESAREKKASSPMAQMILGLFILLSCLGTVYWASRKWLAKHKTKNPHTSIRILTQHYLGPKKSLAIVSVAGESILIGITDHNITSIKTLSLLDGEVPQSDSASFSENLAAAAQTDRDNIEDYAMRGIRDVVNTGLKGMRELV